MSNSPIALFSTLSPAGSARRRLLLAAAASPWLSACATAVHRNRPLAALAQDLGVCAATGVVLRAGQAGAPFSLGGCNGDPPPPVDAVFQAASLTKTVAAYAALRLVAEGRLDLAAPVSRYLPQGYRHFHGVLAQQPGDPSDDVPNDVLARLPVATLLNHTSGLPNWTSQPLAPQFTPGTRWQYSGEGFLLLQRVIEAVTGTDLDTHLQATLFTPLGMRDTSLVWREAFRGRAVVGRAANGVPNEVRFHAPLAAASLYTTAPDFARFLAHLLADVRVLDLTVAQPVLVDAALGLDWARGWGLARGEDGPFLWQWGNNPGFRTFAMVSLASRDGFVLLTNSDRGMPLASALARDVLPPAAQAVFRFPPTN